MEVSGLTVALRPRTSWEAIDLGFGLFRQWKLYALWHWLVFVTPIWLLVIAWGWYAGELWLALLLIWWLKPLYDRILLHPYSRVAFGANPSARETLRAWRAILGHGLLWQLSLLRFDPLRSLRTPIWYLEGQAGAARRHRTRVIAEHTRVYGLILLIAVASFEMIVVLSLSALVWFFAAPELGYTAIDTLRLLSDSSLIAGLALTFYWLAMATFEPVYVAAGFSLYLNRRRLLEGWDLEIAFRKLAARLTSSTLSMVGAILCLALVYSPVVDATTGLASKPKGSAQVERTIAEVLSAEQFNTHEVQRRWHRVDAPSETRLNAPGLSAVERWFSNVSQWLLWLALAVAIAMLAYAIWRSGWRMRLDFHPALRTGGGAVDAASTAPKLPRDLLVAARRLWGEGRSRDALSALYQGTIVELVNAFDIDVTASTTEGELLALIEERLPSESNLTVESLVDTWRNIAYAALPPSESVMSTLFNRWETAFGRSQ